MKTLIIMLVCIGIAQAQSVNPSHSIGRVEADHEDSSEYLARTPYTLHWAVDPKYKLYGKLDPTVKVESYLAGINVYDVTTGKKVASTGDGSFNGSVRVPVAGKHRVKVFCTAPINLSFDEDKNALEAAARRGELKDGMTLDAASETGPRVKKEKIAGLKAEMIKTIEIDKFVIGLDNFELLKKEADRAEQLASSENDFRERFNNLVLVKAREMKASTRATHGRVLNPTPKPASTWNGSGLPPGMQKASEQPLEVGE